MNDLGHKPLILYVEDDALTRQSVRHRLTRQNMRVLQADSGEKALELIKERPALSAALLDLELPGIDGLEICQRLRRNYPGLPVIVCSAHLTAARRRQFAEIGISHPCLLEKPCSVGTVLAAVKGAIGEAHGGHNGHAHEA